MGVVEDRLGRIGIVLPSPDRPIANYVTEVQVGRLLFLAGAGPSWSYYKKSPGGGVSRGKLGVDVDITQGYNAARSVGLVHIARLKKVLKELDRIKRIVKILGMVNCSPKFTEQSSVVDGFSDLMMEVFGDLGLHARSVVGMATLPFNIPVEIEMVVEIID